MEQEKEYTPAHSMREIVRHNSFLLMALSRFDIAFGFGDSSVAEVCAENNVDTHTFLAVCNLLSFNTTITGPIVLPQLIDYLRRAHTSFLEVSLPKIRLHLIEAINHSASGEPALLLMRFFNDYALEVRQHMEHENNVVFGYVGQLLRGEIPGNYSISQFTANHGHMAARLNELRDICIYQYKRRDNARLSATLFDIRMLERDLISHFEIENRLFVPAVSRLEQSLRTSRTTKDNLPSGDIPPAPLPADILSEREKDIIRGVALGKSNKEIADSLCLSIHTVTTHRRNISAKLNIHSPAGITVFAIINRLVDIREISPH